MSAVRCLLFDRGGILLAELEPEWESVSWRLNNAGMAKLALPYGDPKCTKDNLKPGNRLLVQFDDGLPDWGGVIDLPRTRRSTGIQVTAYSGEWLLGLRRTAKGRYFDAAQPGYVFQSLIGEENAEWATGVEVGEVYLGGTARTLEYHYHDLLRRVQDLVRLTGNDFAVLPVYEGGRLTFEAHWYERRGADRSGTVLLVEDRNVEPPVLDEQGTIANRVILVGEGATWGAERLDVLSEDPASRDEYGYREHAEVQAGVTEEATLQANADEMVAEMAWPRERLTLTALNQPPATFGQYDVGDVVRVQAFLKCAEWAYDGSVRIIAREWTPDGRCRLEVETWRG